MSIQMQETGFNYDLYNLDGANRPADPKDVLTFLASADQHGDEKLKDKCIALLSDNLDLESLPTVLELVENHTLPALKLACLNFMLIHDDELSPGLKEKFTEEQNYLKNLNKGGITLELSPQGRIELIYGLAQSYIFDDVPAETDFDIKYELLNELSKKWTIQSITMYSPHSEEQLAKIAKMFPNIEDLIGEKNKPDKEYIACIKKLFPKLNGIGLLYTGHEDFDAVKAYLENFRNTSNADEDKNKPCLRSLDLRKIKNFTDAQFAELTPYLQHIYHLYIESDKITKIIAPKAWDVNCIRCPSLKTIQANSAKWIDCRSCPSLKSVQANHAEYVDCGSCENLEILQAKRAKLIRRFSSPSNAGHAKFETDRAKLLYCYACSIGENKVDCRECEILATKEANQVKLHEASLHGRLYFAFYVILNKIFEWSCGFFSWINLYTNETEKVPDQWNPTTVRNHWRHISTLVRRELHTRY